MKLKVIRPPKYRKHVSRVYNGVVLSVETCLKGMVSFVKVVMII